MPGAPNRPPDKGAPPPPAPVAVEPPERRALRRLVPSHVALLLDSWKGSVPPEIAAPFEKAETAYASGDFASALSALDLLAIRFAEPRWATLPEPFRALRVAIPAPVPPHWDPDHALEPAEKDARKARRAAETELTLADGSLAWALAHGVEGDGLQRSVEEARAALGPEGVPAAFHERLDGFWTALRPRLPRPKGPAARAAPAAPASVPEEA